MVSQQYRDEGRLSQLIRIPCMCPVDYGLERMNNEVSLWMKNANNRWGRPSQVPFIAVRGFDSIVWSRLYSKENFEKPEEKIQVVQSTSASI